MGYEYSSCLGIESIFAAAVGVVAGLPKQMLNIVISPIASKFSNSELRLVAFTIKRNQI